MRGSTYLLIGVGLTVIGGIIMVIPPVTGSDRSDYIFGGGFMIAGLVMSTVGYRQIRLAGKKMNEDKSLTLNLNGNSLGLTYRF
ncbi:MAG: hypothetical protein DRI95_14565 [Bacteroidetes bacterium]|nr:MAG: hypothetical protein DRI95_14565 [Bacteroidota bacterium]